jgi:hypothetical protein
MEGVFEANNNLISKTSGGGAFKTAFQELIVGAEAYSKARLAVAAAQNHVATAKLRVQAADNAVALVKNNAAELQKEEKLYLQLQQQAFDRVLTAKRNVYLELVEYQEAIAYFTLSKSLLQLPSVMASVTDFAEAGTPVKTDTLEVGTSGAYVNICPDGSTKTFTGNPWVSVIKYNAQGDPDVAVGTYARFGQLIFKPTPFTTWTIQPVGATFPSPSVKATLTFTGGASALLSS